jgi:hypothetical protein
MEVKPQLQAVAGSPLWHAVFISFAVVFILFEVVRGWRLGLIRQLVRGCRACRGVRGCGFRRQVACSDRPAVFEDA